MKQIFNKKIFGYSTLLLCILFSSLVNAQTNSTQERVHIKIEIKGMACPYCAFGMEKKLKEISGVNNVEIELKEGLAYISTLKAQQPTKESIQDIIINAGFTVGKIQYSDIPFVRKKTNK